MTRRIFATFMAVVLTLLPAVNVLADTGTEYDAVSEAFELSETDETDEIADIPGSGADELEEAAEYDGTLHNFKEWEADPEDTKWAASLSAAFTEVTEFEPENSETMLSIYHEAKEAYASQPEAAGGTVSGEIGLLADPGELYADFPESYRTLLLSLHALYPQWKFVADNTGLDWEEALDEEAIPSRSLVENSEPDSWKSRKDSDYDKTHDRWKVYDGSVWVAANREITAYYMDPRNWMQVTYSGSGELIRNKSIFQFLDYSYDPEIQTREGVVSMTAGTFLAGTPSGGQTSYVDMIMDAAQDWGISPYVLTAFIIQEQGQAGTSPLISGSFAEYPGIYNFLNIGAYSTSTMTSIQRGLWWADGEGKGSTSFQRPWNSRQKAINGGAQYLSEKYLDRYQNTIYYKRFNVNPDNTETEPYTHQYMTNIAGAWAEGYLLGKSCETNGVLYESYTFHIPVYDNMPEEPCAKPDDTMLSSLSIEGYELNEEFAIDRYEYTIDVPEDTGSVVIDSTPAARTASVSGNGLRNLTGESTSLKLTVTSHSGSTGNVTVTVRKQETKLLEAVDLTNNQSIFVRFYDEAPGCDNADNYTVRGTEGTVTGVSDAEKTGTDIVKINFPFPLEADTYTLFFDNGEGLTSEAEFKIGLDISVYDMKGRHSIILKLSNPIVGCTDPDNYYVYPLGEYEKPLTVTSAVSAFYEVHTAARNVFSLTFEEELMEGQTYVAETRNMCLWKDDDETKGIVGERCQGTICYFTYDGKISCEVLQVTDESNIVVRFAEPVTGCTRPNNYMVIDSNGVVYSPSSVSSAFEDMKGEVANVFKLRFMYPGLPDGDYTVRTRGLSEDCREAEFNLDSEEFMKLTLIRRGEKSLYIQFDRDVEGCTDPANYRILDNSAKRLVPVSVTSAYTELDCKYPGSFRLDFADPLPEGSISVYAINFKENGRYLNEPHLLVRSRSYYQN